MPLKSSEATKRWRLKNKDKDHEIQKNTTTAIKNNHTHELFDSVYLKVNVNA